MSGLMNSFLNLIYNKKCLICGCAKTDDLLCKSCQKDVEYLSSFAHRIYKHIPIYSAFLYKNNIKKLIQMLKFSHKKSASKVLSQLLFNYFEKLNFKNNYVIIFPPSFFLKSACRGYNHMFLIAKEFSKLTNNELIKDFIIKTRYTKPQYRARNRQKNIKDSFKINQKYIQDYKDKNILLIDDITTTGATLDEIINKLLENGFYNITCLTISKSSC